MLRLQIGKVHCNEGQMLIQQLIKRNVCLNIEEVKTEFHNSNS